MSKHSEGRVRLIRPSWWAGLVVLVVAAIACDSGCRRDRGGGPTSVELQRARAVTALAAVLEAASQATTSDEQRERLRRFGVAPAASDAVERAYPVRRELKEAVRQWPAERREAASAWVNRHATWTTLLHAMVLESYDGSFVPRDWGPSMQRFDLEIWRARTTLAPFLVAALEDPAIEAIASRLATPADPFTAAGVDRWRKRTLAYLRLEDELPQLAGFFNPLLAPGTGVNAELPGGEVLLVVGPDADPEQPELVLVHELAHQPIFRVLNRPGASRALEASACAFEMVRERYGYETWQSYFAESLVRALSYRLKGVAVRDTGFVFERELYDALVAWEAQEDGDFEEAVVQMLEGIRAGRCG